MREPTTTTVEIDTDLLEELRAEMPGKPDRELIEDMAQRTISMAVVRRVRSRSGLTEEEATELAVQPVHQGRGKR